MDEFCLGFKRGKSSGAGDHRSEFRNLYLPEDIVVQILSRLSPKSLMRFRCVRKSWNNLITSPSFVAKHLSHSLHNKLASSTCVLYNPDATRDFSLTLLSLISNDNTHQHDHNNLHLAVAVEDLNVPPHWGELPLGLAIAGHCNGIICLYIRYIDGSPDIFLCNPSLKEFRHLPKSCFRWDYYTDNTTKAVGFAYDSKAKDYKVVRIVDFWTDSFRHPRRAEVYNLGSNSWREIKIKTDIIDYPFYSGMSFNGICYWWASDAIISFDIISETFHVTSVPDFLHASYEYTTALVEWKDSIALLTYERATGISKSFHVWAMEGFGGVTGSWTKQLTVGPLEGIGMPLVFWKKDELLMVTNDADVVSYDLGTQRIKNIPILGMINPRFNCYYQPALVSVNSIISVREAR